MSQSQNAPTLTLAWPVLFGVFRMGRPTTKDAHAAGLRWVNDDVPGIRRIGSHCAPIAQLPVAV